MFRAFLSIVALIGAFSAAAGELSSPEGRVVLTVTGDVEHTNGDGRAEFDRSMLEALDWREITTFTTFTEGPRVFAGPTLASVLDATGARGAQITATAINDYAVTFQALLARDHLALLAMDMDGKPMRIRDKGPIWIVFPLAETQLSDAPFDHEMVWQLARLHIEP